MHVVGQIVAGWRKCAAWVGPEVGGCVGERERGLGKGAGTHGTGLAGGLYTACQTMAPTMALKAPAGGWWICTYQLVDLQIPAAYNATRQEQCGPVATPQGQRLPLGACQALL